MYMPHTIREANHADIPALVAIRLALFDEAGTMPPSADMPTVERLTYEYFTQKLGAGFWCWVVEIDGQIAATAACTLYEKPPHGKNYSGREGYIVNVYTKPEFRHRGYANGLIETILAWLKRLGIIRVRLHATRGGVDFYSRLGFAATDNEMEVYL